MSTNDDEDSKNGSACGFNLIMFILTIIVFVNVNSLMFGITGCDLTIVSMVTYLILAIVYLVRWNFHKDGFHPHHDFNQEHHVVKQLLKINPKIKIV